MPKSTGKQITDADLDLLADLGEDICPRTLWPALR